MDVFYLIQFAARNQKTLRIKQQLFHLSANAHLFESGGFDTIRTAMKARNAPRSILITFDISSIAGREQLAGVLRFLRERPNWMPRLISRPQDITPEIVRNAKAENIDGIIINHAGSHDTENTLAQSAIPLAVIGIRNPKLVARSRNIILVKNDNERTGRIVARYLLSLGNYRAFGYVPATPATEEWSLSRERGFRLELSEHKLSVDTFAHDATSGTEESREALAKWIKGLPKPAAIFGSWDYPAMQVLETCRREKIKVPQAVAVIGVDNDPMICEAANPPLTSVACDYEQEGYESAAALARLLERGKPCNTAITVTCKPTEVVERESAAPIAPASQLVKRALRFIEQKACKGISTKDVAKELGVSQSLLSLRFREFSDESVLDAIIRVRLERVKLLLTTTRRKFTEIARSSGFRNVNYLTNLFAERLGMSMREYRAANLTATAVTAPARGRSGKGGRAPKKRRQVRRGGSAA